jgi:hypothetical protein
VCFGSYPHPQHTHYCPPVFIHKHEVWAGGVAQVVEYRLSKYETLSSNSSHCQKK